MIPAPPSTYAHFKSEVGGYFKRRVYGFDGVGNPLIYDRKSQQLTTAYECSILPPSKLTGLETEDRVVVPAEPGLVLEYLEDDAVTTSFPLIAWGLSPDAEESDDCVSHYACVVNADEAAAYSSVPLVRWVYISSPVDEGASGYRVRRVTEADDDVLMVQR
jgi:hypothetical protein